MGKQVDIADKFDSASETKWIGNNWKLGPHTRSIKEPLLLLMIISLLGIGYYIKNDMNAEKNWRIKMHEIHELYVPYNAAVTKIKELEYCNIPVCLDRKQELIKIRDEAWKSLCNAEGSEGYIRNLKDENLPYQACD